MANMRENKVPSEISLISVLLFLLQLFFSLNQVNSYVPDDNLAVNCGYSGNTTSTIDNRKWVGDVDVTKLFSTIEPQTGQKSVKAEALNSLPSSVPFGSARLSYSNFTYSFPVVTTNGPVFLRLHFYPTSYAANFEPSNALFSVKVGSNLTLLKDFNASLWVNNDQKTVTKEYCIQMEAAAAGERLNVTFLPSTTTNHSDAAYYAFINGIEIGSMPPFLYYTNPNPDDFNNYYTIKYVRRSIQYQVLNDKALETLYRVNVGEKQVPPSQDTGMFRYWDNDFPRYLEKQYPLSVSGGSGLHLKYRNNTAVKDYTAPADVYLTARNYGQYATENYNVTWNFEVDSEFTYMVRLHFCEFVPEIQQKGDRVFQIFIADSLVEPKADVIGWSGGNLIPVYKDYAVPVYRDGSSESQRRVNISVKLQRLPVGYSVYRDVLMNGIEIFKISDENNLAGQNLKPLILSPNQQQILPTQSSNKSKSSIVIVAAVAAVSALVLASIAGTGITIFVRRRRSTQSSHNNDDNMEENSSWKTKNEGSSSLPSHLCRYFTIAEIRAATNNFNDVFIVGIGGFSNVYKGYIDGSTPVAIKCLKPGSQQGANEFMNEIEVLCQLDHPNLVSLIGFCDHKDEKILVYEYVSNGFLDKHLGDSIMEPLSWKKRLEICIGIACGLHYLHSGTKCTIFHRGIKPRNILLDDNMVPKLTDFALSLRGPHFRSKPKPIQVDTIKGTIGYLAPEYVINGTFTDKSDVYSFGMVLLKMVCVMEEQAIFERCLSPVEENIYPILKGKIVPECWKIFMDITKRCLKSDPNDRPIIGEVEVELEHALSLQEEADIRNAGGYYTLLSTTIIERWMGPDRDIYMGLLTGM